MAGRPLQDVTVVEYAESIAAPFCARLLADFGATVIKVERPSGDPARRLGPFPDDVPHPERSALYQYVNRGKEGVTLDIESPTGKALLLRLIGQADIFVTSVKGDEARAQGLDYKALKELRPPLQLTAVTPFGWAGPYRGYDGNSATLSHAGGWGYINPRLAPTKDIPPLTPPGHLAEFYAGLCAASASMLAFFLRNRNGTGQLVDVSIQDTAVNLMMLNFARYSGTGKVDSRVGRSFGAPLHVVRCKDGYIYAQCETQEQWERFVELMGSPDWATDPLFATRYSRADNWEALAQLMDTWFLDHTMDEIYHESQRHRIPFGPVVTAADVRESRQLAARGFFVPAEDPDMGGARYPGSPVRMEKSPWHAGGRAPRLGEHSDAVFSGRLGLSKAEVMQLRQAGVI